MKKVGFNINKFFSKNDACFVLFLLYSKKKRDLVCVCIRFCKTQTDVEKKKTQE